MPKTSKDILRDYEKKMDELTKRVHTILFRVTRVAEDAEYRRTLEKINKISNG